MDPISGIAGIMGLVSAGMQFGAGQQMAGAARDEANASMNIAGLQMQQNDQRRKQMALQGQRQQLQNLRNAQLARSMAITSATAQGVQLGTGLSGGLGQISGDYSTNALGIGQNLQIGNKMFDIDNQIGVEKMASARAGARMADAQGQSAMWGSIGKASGSFGKVGADIFGMMGSIGKNSSNGMDMGSMWGGGVDGTNSNGWF